MTPEIGRAKSLNDGIVNTLVSVHPTCINSIPQPLMPGLYWPACLPRPTSTTRPIDHGNLQHRPCLSPAMKARLLPVRRSRKLMNFWTEGQELKVSKSDIWLFCIFLAMPFLSFRERPVLPVTTRLSIASCRSSSRSLLLRPYRLRRF